MTTGYLSPFPKFRAFKADGTPAAGYKLYTYDTAGTLKATYTDAAAGTPNANPVVLDANGEADVWLDGAYDLTLKSDTDVTQWSVEDVRGVGAFDATVQVSEWQSTGDSPTFIDATSFSVPTDKRSTYPVGIRLQAEVTAGTVYGRVIAVAFASSTTTVTLEMDSGDALDSGLSSVSVGLLSPTSPSTSLVFAGDVPRVLGPYTVGGGMPELSIGTDTDHDVDVTAGVVFDCNDGSPIFVPALTKQIDAAFAAGTDAGGMLTGAVAADTGYYLWAFRNPTSGAVDVGFHTGGDYATVSGDLPSGYTKCNLIGFWPTDSSSNLEGMRWEGDLAILDAVRNEVIDSTLTDDTFETLTCARAPARSLAHFSVLLNNSTQTGTQLRATIRPKGTTWIAGTACSIIHMDNDSDPVDQATAMGWLPLDEAAEIEYAAEEASGSATIYIYMLGFIMLTRGRAPLS